MQYTYNPGGTVRIRYKTHGGSIHSKSRNILHTCDSEIINYHGHQISYRFLHASHTDLLTETEETAGTSGDCNYSEVRPVETKKTCRNLWWLELQWGGLMETCRNRGDYRRLQGPMRTVITVRCTDGDLYRQRRLQEPLVTGEVDWWRPVETVGDLGDCRDLWGLWLQCRNRGDCRDLWGL